MKPVDIPIDGAGRVVLPKNVRDDLAIEPGDTLAVSVRGNEITLRPNKVKAGFIRRGKALIFSSGGKELLDRETVDRIIAEERDKRIDAFIPEMMRHKKKR